MKKILTVLLVLTLGATFTACGNNATVSSESPTPAITATPAPTTEPAPTPEPTVEPTPTTESNSESSTSFVDDPALIKRIQTKFENFCTKPFVTLDGYSFDLTVNAENTGYTAKILLPVLDESATTEQLDETLAKMVVLFTELQSSELLSEPYLTTAHISIISGAEMLKEQVVEFN